MKYIITSSGYFDGCCEKGLFIIITVLTKLKFPTIICNLLSTKLERVANHGSISKKGLALNKASALTLLRYLFLKEQFVEKNRCRS